MPCQANFVESEEGVTSGGASRDAAPRSIFSVSGISIDHSGIHGVLSRRTPSADTEFTKGRQGDFFGPGPGGISEAVKFTRTPARLPPRCRRSVSFVTQVFSIPIFQHGFRGRSFRYSGRSVLQAAFCFHGCGPGIGLAKRARESKGGVQILRFLRGLRETLSDIRRSVSQRLPHLAVAAFKLGDNLGCMQPAAAFRLIGPAGSWSQAALVAPAGNAAAQALGGGDLPHAVEVF